MGEFEGKVVYITGAARGQGRAHALRFAAAGADIIATDICADIGTVRAPLASVEDLAETVREVEALGRRIVAQTADVRSLDQIAASVAAGIAAFGRLDVVVANAGIGGRKPSVEVTDTDWNDVIDVDLTGVWHTIAATMPHLIAGGRGGSVIITSSTAGLKGFPQMAAYTAAKHGVVGLMKSLAVELAPHMIRVNTVNPTTVNSPMVRTGDLHPTRGEAQDNPVLRRAVEYFTEWNAIPVPWVETDDIANAVVFLASDAARYITGVSLPVDAGSMVKWSGAEGDRWPSRESATQVIATA